MCLNMSQYELSLWITAVRPQKPVPIDPCPLKTLSNKDPVCMMHHLVLLHSRISKPPFLKCVNMLCVAFGVVILWSNMKSDHGVVGRLQAGDLLLCFLTTAWEERQIVICSVFGRFLWLDFGSFGNILCQKFPLRDLYSLHEFLYFFHKFWILILIVNAGGGGRTGEAGEHLNKLVWKV